MARAHGVSPQQVTLAWELAQAPVVVPIPGASRPETIVDSLKAAELQLSADELRVSTAADRAVDVLVIVGDGEAPERLHSRPAMSSVPHPAT